MAATWPEFVGVVHVAWLAQRCELRAAAHVRRTSRVRRWREGDDSAIPTVPDGHLYDWDPSSVPRPPDQFKLCAHGCRRGRVDDDIRAVGPIVAVQRFVENVIDVNVYLEVRSNPLQPI